MCAAAMHPGLAWGRVASSAWQCVFLACGTCKQCIPRSRNPFTGLLAVIIYAIIITTQVRIGLIGLSTVCTLLFYSHRGGLL